MSRPFLRTLTALVSIALLGILAVHAATSVWPDQIRDVHSYWHAAESLLSGGTGLYDTEGLAPGVWPYVYPPAFAALFVPLLLLPTAVGYMAWAMVVSAGVVASFWALRRLGRLGGRPMSLLVVALALPVFQVVSMGQVDALVVALLALALLAEREGRSVRTGMLIGLAAAIKVIPALALLPFLVLRRWRVVAAAGASVVALSMLPLPWLLRERGLGSGVVRLAELHAEFVDQVLARGLGQLVTEDWMLLPWNASLPGTALRLVHAPELGVAAMWLLVLWGTWLSHRTWDPGVGVALVVAGAALGNFVFWSHNAFLFALPLAIAFSATACVLTLFAFVSTIWVTPILGTAGYLAVWGRCAAEALRAAPDAGDGPEPAVDPDEGV